MPTLPDLVFLVLVALLVGTAGVALTQSDGDLFAHLRQGDVIRAAGRVPHESLLGVVTAGDDAVAPAWLAELLLAMVARVAGLGGVVVFAALTIAGAHAVVAGLLRRAALPLTWVLAGTAGSILLGSTHWLARPHLASLLGAALLVSVLESPVPRRWLLAAPLMLGWANLHGGFAYGLALLMAYAAGDAWEAWRARPNRAALARARWRGLAAVVGALATLATPYGLALHRAVWRSLRDPALAAAMDEARPPGFAEPGDVLFLGVVLAVIAWAVRRPPRLRRTTLLVVLLSIAAGLASGRHIALFAVTGWPLLVRAAAPRGFGTVLGAVARREAQACAGWWASTGAIGLALGTLLWRGRPPVRVDVDPTRFPVAAVAWLRCGADEDPARVRLFTPWTWGGYLVYGWPGARAFVDPLVFGPDDLAAYGRVIGATPAALRELDGWGVTTVLAPARSALADLLPQSGAWNLAYRDGTAVVFSRRNASTGTTVAAGSSSCGTWPSASNRTTRLPTMSRAKRSASVGGISRSRPPQRTSVGIRSVRTASVSATRGSAENRASNAVRFPSRSARS